MKKSFIIMLLVLVVFALSACSNSRNEDDLLTKEVIANNLSSDSLKKIRKTDIFVTSIPNEGVAYRSYYNRGGILVMEYNDNRISCWSLINGKKIVDDKNIYIDFINVYNNYVDNTYYLQVQSYLGYTTVYDVLGNVVVKHDKYVHINIYSDVELKYDENGELLLDAYTEIIETITESDYNAGINKPKVTKNIIDLEKRTRVKVETTKTEYYQDSDKSKTDLKTYGLEGYKGSIYNGFLYVYNSDGEAVNSIDLNSVKFYTGIDGKLIIQKAFLVNQNSDDYTYIENGSKYLLKSYSQDLLTGKIEDLNLEYILREADGFKNTDNEYVYGFARISEIENKNLQMASKYVLIDSKGNKVSRSIPFNINLLRKLNDDYYLDTGSSYILDGNLNPILTLLFPPKVSPNKELLILQKDGLYGAIRYDGEVVIPFEYSSLESDFYFDVVFGVHLDGTSYFVNEKQKTPINRGWRLLSQGLLINTKYNTSKGVYESIIYDYKSNPKAIVESSNSELPSSYSFSNLYGEFLVQEFYGVDTFSYVLVDRTYKKLQ